MTLSVAGQSVVRRDLKEKLTGEARYTADLKLPGMAHGLVLRSPHPHADILSVDVSAALQAPGVLAIVTPFDAPPGRVALDLPILDTRVRFVGDEVAAVAAVDLDAARRALELVRVEYRVLPFILDPEEALPGAGRRGPGLCRSRPGL
jgi:CO/xanthine dehydrogenase Mo-binding subunit